MFVEVMRSYRCENIIFSGSATVYGALIEISITENCPKGVCINPDGWNKSSLSRV